MSQFISNPEEVKEVVPRFRIYYYALAVVLILYTTRLWYLQMIKGTELREISEKNRIKQIKVVAPRGIVFDREGRTLIENRPGFEAIVNPQYIEDTEDLAKEIAPLIGFEPKKLETKINRSRRVNGPFVSIRLKENLSRDEVFRVKRARINIPGLDIKESILRHYPLKSNGAQMFGYISEISNSQLPLYNKMYHDLKFEQGDLVGKSGLEELLERDLRGTDGVQFIQVDVFGRNTGSKSEQIFGEYAKDIPPVPGHNITLTIDQDIQSAAWTSFVEKNNRLGGLVVMKSSGEILAWVNSPSFDPNEFSSGVSKQLWSQLINDPFQPMRNKVIQDHFPPGSTFKPFVAIAALQEKVASQQTSIFCNGLLPFGKRVFHDHLKGGHGAVNVYDAIERSCNIFFYRMGIALGVDRMFQYISLFGLGARTGIELKREAAGLLPNSQWKKQKYGEAWQPGENLSVAIGGGLVDVTPLQLAVGYNTIGLEGKVVQPFIVKKVTDLKGKILVENQPKVIRDLQEPQKDGTKIDKETFKTVKEALRRVVHGNRGTAGRVRIPGVEIGGKTGTAQVKGWAANEIMNYKCETMPLKQRHHGWFIAFAPVENPEVTVAVLAEHSCHGSSGAGTIAKDLFQAYFQKYRPDLVKPVEAKKSDKPVIQHLDNEE